MMKRVLATVFTGIIVAASAVGLASMPAQAATNFTFDGGVQSAKGTGVPTEVTGGDDSLITKIINILLYVVGILSVFMLIFGGIKYVVSGGKNEQVTSAKNTILYAVVGLVIAIFAYAIIQFVIGSVTGGGGADV